MQRVRDLKTILNRKPPSNLSSQGTLGMQEPMEEEDIRKQQDGHPHELTLEDETEAARTC